MARMMLALAFVAGTSLVTGCASTIGNTADIGQVTFEVGKTNKNEVANTLGFPQNRVVQDGTEYWGYRGKPELTGLVYALPSGPNTVTTYQATKIRTEPLQMDSVDVIYAFDDNGTLIGIHEPAK
ncbi:MAG TPA: hypothetical protein VF200_11910 [Woeseiaceae bacterium]